jgi:hypothetical protein
MVNNAGVNDRVTLRGLAINGVGTGIYGVYILSAATVHLDNMRIWGFRGANGSGIRVAPNGVGVELHVKDSYILDNGPAGAGGGIVLVPAGNVNLRAILSRVEMRDNSYGLIVTGAGATSGYVRVTGSNVVIAGNNSDGINVAGGGAAASVFLDRSAVMSNGSYGILISGSNASAIIGRSAVADNGQGLGTAGGAALYSYGTNQINGNGVDGSPTAGLMER